MSPVFISWCAPPYVEIEQVMKGGDTLGIWKSILCSLNFSSQLIFVIPFSHLLNGKSVEADGWSVHCKLVMLTGKALPAAQVLCTACVMCWHRLCSLASGRPTVAPFQHCFMRGSCGCSGEMAALSRLQLWLGDFIWVPHCHLSSPTQFRKEDHVAKPGYMLTVFYRLTLPVKIHKYFIFR